MKKTIRTLALSLAALGLVVPANTAMADTWPSQPIEFVVPANPGGDSDINCRIFLKYLEKELGQSMVVVNMAGAAGAVGMNNVRQARPNGYRALFYHAGALIGQLMDFVDFSIPEAFEVAAMPVMDKSNCFAVNAKAPYNNIAELVAYAKANPGKVSFATESGSFTHLHALALEQAAGIKFNIADAGTASEKITALLGGRIDIIGTQYGLIKGYIQNGEFKCIGLLSDQKLPSVDNVRTFGDDGYKLVFDKFFYVAFPKGTPTEILDKFNAAAKKVSENPDYIAENKKNYVETSYSTREDGIKYINGQIENYRKYEKALTGN